MEIDFVQTWNARKPRYRPSGEVINPSEYEVMEFAGDRECKAFIAEHHYLGSMPAARHNFGLYRRGELVGVTVYSHPTNERALDVLPGQGLERIELGRLVLLDSVPTNSESWFVAQTHRLLSRQGIVSVLTFADPVPRTNEAGEVIFSGHLGVTYQAGGASFLGRATPRTLRILPDGRAMSPRSIQKIRARERGYRYAVDQLVAAGAAPPQDGEDLEAWLKRAIEGVTRPLKHPGTLKYAFAINKRYRKFLPRSQPYPKVRLTESQQPLITIAP